MAAATEQATAHASDPERVQRIRDLVGYDDDGERANSNTNEPTSERTLRREARDSALDRSELDNSKVLLKITEAWQGVMAFGRG